MAGPAAIGADQGRELGVFADVVGQPEAVAALTRAAVAPVHAYLFVGPNGTGKREAARGFAALLLDPSGDPDSRDSRLVLAGEHPDVREIARVGAAISVEQAAEIVQLASRAPTESARKVIVLDEFHLIRAEAAAKLLKTIEEPPPSTVFVILAELVTPELVTIASRCNRIEFRPLTDAVVESALRSRGVGAETSAAAARSAGGSMARALLLASDAHLAERRRRFAEVPRRLDGTGRVVAREVEELLAAIDEAAEPLKTRHAKEIEALDERAAANGDKPTAGRKSVEDRHKRELRRHRTDELKAGLAALAATYRDVLAAGSAHHPGALVTAVSRVHRTIEDLERNPNEALQLQALLLSLPSVDEAQ